MCPLRAGPRYPSHATAKPSRAVRPVGRAPAGGAMVDDVRSGAPQAAAGRAPRDAPYECHVAAATANLAELRRTLRAWLEATVDDPNRRTDIVLAASELAVAAMRAVPS